MQWVLVRLSVVEGDKEKIAFSSNRLNGGTHDTNVFVADWVE